MTYRWGRTESRDTSGGADELFQTVRDALRSRRDLVRWRLTGTVARERQVYLVREEVEAERTVARQSVGGVVYVGQGDEMGSSSFQIEPGAEARIDRDIEEAIVLARESRFRAYPENEMAELPEVETVDSEIARDPAAGLARLSDRLVETTTGAPGVRLASAEFFLTHNQSRMENSQGLEADLSGTEAAAELVILGQSTRGREAEVQGLRYRRRISGLEVEAWAAELGEQARDSARAEPMPTWRGPVVLRSDELGTFVGPVVERLSAQSKYRKMSPYEVGDSVIEGEYRGDRMTLGSDRTLPFGRSTAPCDSEGFPAGRITVVEDGRVRRFWADAQYGHYAGIPSTGGWANLILEPGSRPVSSLFRGGEVLEVVKFSWFTPSRGTGDFASEMRFGYLHRNGQRVPVKGGTVTGNVFSALGHAYFSRETDFVGDGRVPARMRLEDVLVAGAPGSSS